jgi:hypothetical protein
MPATPKQQLRAILKAGNYRLAYKAAKECGPIDLLEAMQLTILAATHDRDHFEKLAVHWIERLLAEREVSVFEIGWVAERFQDAWEERPTTPERALTDFLKRAPLRL